MEFFHHPRHADYHEGEADTVDQSPKAVGEPVGQNGAADIGPSVKEVGDEVGSQGSCSGRPYQFEPSGHPAASQIRQEGV